MEFQVGEYGVSQWGYDQTNTDFYKVVKKTEKSVWLLPVQEITETTGFMSGVSVPSEQPHNWKNKVIVKRIKSWKSNDRIDEYCGGWFDSETVYPWDKKPQITTWYA